MTSFLAFTVKSNEIIIEYMVNNCKFSYVQSNPPWLHPNPISQLCQRGKKKKKVSSLPQIEEQTK